MSIKGMKQFLLDLGFVEASGSFNLSQNVLINDLRIMRDTIKNRHDLLLKGNVPEPPMATPGPSKVQIPGRPRFNGKYSCTRKVTLECSTHPFLSTIDGILQQVLSYEDAALQEFGRSLIPVEKLRLEALERMRVLQKSLSVKDGSQDPVYEDVLLIVFTEWFNRSFFTWVNKVPCKVCGSIEGTRQSPSYVENGIRVEEIFCCGQPSKFYRYNDIATLLVTRQVGEYDPLIYLN